MLFRTKIEGLFVIACFAVGCSDLQSTETGTQGAATAASNGLPDINGLTSYNGLNSHNGLNVHNGLTSYNGLNSYNGLMSSSDGRLTVSYLVRCALAAGDSIVKQDQYNATYTFNGAMGLAPQWKTDSCDTDCQEMISSCMLAHINTSGTHIPLWIVGPMAAVGWGQSPYYSTREGTFFGNIFEADSSGVVRAHYCTASSVSTDTVPGRLGANQKGAPYTDPYSSPGYCDSHCAMDGTYGNDGASSCPADGRSWTHPLTVWRGQTFQAEKGVLSSGANYCTCPAGTNCSAGARVCMTGTTSNTKFTGVKAAASGTNDVVVYYENGDWNNKNPRYFNIIVNGGAPQLKGPFLVVTPGVWTDPKGVTVTLSGFISGSNNTIVITTDRVHAAPDLDWIEILPSSNTRP